MAPSTLGARVDAYYKARLARLTAEDKIKDMKEKEVAAKEEILRMLTDQKLDGAKGKLATVAITSTEFPRIVDYQALTAYILKTGAVELLEKRPSKAACLERWEDGAEVPGVERETRVDLSFTKASR